MLKVRVWTAAILAPLFILGVLELPGTWFAALLGFVVLAAAWEWTGLADYPRARWRTAGVAGAGLLMAAVFPFRDRLADPVALAACAVWLLVAISLWRRRHTGPLHWPRPARWLSGVWVLVPAWLALSVLQEVEPETVLMLLLLIWAADIGAYFAGRRWGRRRLAPAISPGKTWEGVLGGTAASVPVAAAFAWYWDFDVVAWPAFLVWSAFISVVSISGDLFESNWKRLASLKDSSGLLPGHGGILDRIDSITAAAPFFALGWLWWFGSSPA